VVTGDAVRPRRLLTRRLLTLLAALALLAAACERGEQPDGGADEPAPQAPTDEPTDEPTEEADDADEVLEGGTVVWALEQEPATLLPIVTGGNLYATSQITLPVLLPLFHITPDAEYRPTSLLADWEVDEDPTEDAALAVTYVLDEDARWSDGEPVTAADLLFTIEVNRAEDLAATSRAIWSQIDLATTAEGVDPDAAELTVFYPEPYAFWQSTFATASGIVLPEHVLGDREPAELGDLWTLEQGIVDPATDEPIASGPFQLDSVTPGERVRLVRNDAYGGQAANLDALEFAFIPESGRQLQQLRAGTVDLIDPQVQLDLVAQLEEMEGIDFQTDLGPTWEHLSLQSTREPLDQRVVRQAIGYALDREAFVAELLTPIQPDAEPLSSLHFMTDQPEYEPSFAEALDGDAQDAVALLEDSGCERDDDEIFRCEGERLELDWVSTAGNERRELFLELAQRDLLDAGIAINEDLRDPAEAFSADLLDAGAYELHSFAWIGAPEPASAIELWGCFERDEDGTPQRGATPDDPLDPDWDGYGAQNHHRHCPEPEVSDTLLETRRTLDADERAALFNEVDAALAEDLPVIPLFQLPHVVAYNERVTGIELNTTQQGQVWNVAEWGVRER